MAKKTNFIDSVKEEIKSSVKKDFDEDSIIKKFRELVSKHLRDDFK
ncbi:hypothetical protein LCGC14_1084480 [marine sediment metagenome]|uniref:Uncharacterized protein n=1 Tax=marine sediment metagenome TaxID=412755 RepID=A0A0F9PXE1_9ZZZZ